MSFPAVVFARRHIQLATSRARDLKPNGTNLLKISPKTQRDMRIANLKSVLLGRPVRFRHDETTGLFYAHDGAEKHAFGHFRRGRWLYKQGLAQRADALWRSYTLQNITFSRDDLVIDCGANYADLWLTLKHHIAPENYITFEPGQREHLSIVQNAPKAKANNLGLGAQNETITLYVNEKDADSSFIEPTSYNGTLEIETVTLDHYLTTNKTERVKLLKLEAEGFEPEILSGATQVLDRVEYVAIDGGYERGVSQDQTFTHQANLLAAHSFEMVDINLKWGRALFRNTAF